MKRTMGMGLALSAALGLGTLAFSSALAETPAGSITTNTGGILLQNGGFNGSNFNATVGGVPDAGIGGGSYLTNTNVNQTTNNSTAAVVGSGNSLNANINTNCAGICIKGSFPSGGPMGP